MDADDDAPRGDVTELLIRWRRGDKGAAGRLFPLVYARLRAQARRQLGRGPRGATLDTTGLVHETYLKLVAQDRVEAGDREHFLAIAARAMRQIVVDHVRARAAQKRGGGAPAGPLDENAAPLDARIVEILTVDQALSRLEALDPRLAALVELRFFGGLSLEEIALAQGLSERTLRRDWQRARAFLKLALAAPSD